MLSSKDILKILQFDIEALELAAVIVDPFSELQEVEGILRATLLATGIDFLDLQQGGQSQGVNDQRVGLAGELIFLHLDKGVFSAGRFVDQLKNLVIVLVDRECEV